MKCVKIKTNQVKPNWIDENEQEPKLEFIWKLVINLIDDTYYYRCDDWVMT